MRAVLASVALMLALAVLILLWQLWLAPPARMPAWLAAALHASPLLPGTILLLRGRPSFGFWAGLAALFLFAHGVMEAWAAPRVRLLALCEALLAGLLVISASWNGLRARFARRRDV